VVEAAATDVAAGIDLIGRRTCDRHEPTWQSFTDAYKNWLTPIARLYWGLSNSDTWIQSRTTARNTICVLRIVGVLYDRGLCYSTWTTQLRRSAIFDGDPGIPPGFRNPFTHSIFARFDT